MNAPDRASTTGHVAGPAEQRVTLVPGRSATHPSPKPSQLRAWLYLIWLSLHRQSQSRQMVWIALGLLGLSVALVAVNTAAGRWGLQNWRYPRREGPTYPVVVDDLQVLTMAFHRTQGAQSLDAAVYGSCRILVAASVRTENGKQVNLSAFPIFSKRVLFSIFLAFLLPVWSLAFATEAMGGERESGTLVWLFTRPLSRPGIYLAKFLALLPWSVGFNLFGFAAMCLAAGQPGWQALWLYWPAVILASLAFSALFFFLGAVFRWPAVLGMVYSFCLESILGNMPGYMKRVSIGFYTRCLMFEAAENYGVQPENPLVFLPVSGLTALTVLIGVTVALVVGGMVIFSQMQYREQV